MSKTEDLQWIARVKFFDDKSAFDKLTLKYQSPVRRFLLNLTMGDSSWSDDLAQDTFVKAYLNISSFQGLSAFSTWLFRIAYHTYCDQQKTRKYYSNIDLIHQDAFSVENEYTGHQTDIYRAMQTLRTEEKTAVLLFYMEDKTQAEVAKIMNCPLGTVKTYLLKGKEKLSNYLIEKEYAKP